METNIDEIARHFERYPNFAVDTAARVPYLMLQPPEKVRAFLTRYQNRVLYATDLAFSQQDNTQEAIKEWKDTYAQDWKYFAEAGTIDYKGHKIQGLKLPEAVLRGIFHDNALLWIPGIRSRAR
jgi:predicted TIM-barrel fold metal-dependent hydrolase